MSEALVALAVLGSLVIAMVLLALVAKRVRRRGTAGPAIGAAMAAYDEAMHSTAYDQFVEMQAQQDRKLAMPAPDDPDRARGIRSVPARE